jgi:hypothetical protein
LSDVKYAVTTADLLAEDIVLLTIISPKNAQSAADLSTISSVSTDISEIRCAKLFICAKYAARFTM